PAFRTISLAQLTQIHLGLAECLLCEVLGVGLGAGQSTGIAKQSGIVFLNKPLDISLAAGHPHGTTSSIVTNRARAIYSRKRQIFSEKSAAGAGRHSDSFLSSRAMARCPVTLRDCERDCQHKLARAGAAGSDLL